MENAPDLSLMAKARAGFHGPYGLGINQFLRGIGGPEYIVNLLTGYTGEDREEAGAILYENTAFPSGWIAMPPPLYGDDVVFEDGSPTDIVSEAQGRRRVPDVDGRAQARRAQAGGLHGGPDAGDPGGAALPDQQADLGADQASARQDTRRVGLEAVVSRKRGADRKAAPYFYPPPR